MPVETLRPSSYTTSYSGTGAHGVTSAGNAYDANLSTYGTTSATALGKGYTSQALQLKGWGLKAYPYISWAIKAKISAYNIDNGWASGGLVSISTSTNGGSSYTPSWSASVDPGGSVAEQTVTLASGTGDPTWAMADLIVNATAKSNGTGDTSGQGDSIVLQVFEVWMEGAYSLQVNLTAGTGIYPALAKAFPILRAAGYTASATIGRLSSYLRAATASATSAASMVRRIGDTLAASIGKSATLARVLQARRNLTVTMTQGATLGVLRSKVLAATRATVATIARQRGRVVAAAQSLAATVSITRMLSLLARAVASPGQNLVRQSQDFNVTPWSLVRAALDPGFYLAPDGTGTARKLLDSVDASNSHYISQSISTTLADNSTYTLSAYLKAAEYNSAVIHVRNKSNTYYYASVDLTNGSTIPYGSPISVASQNIGNGWYRLSLTVTSGAGANTPVAVIYPYTSSAFTGTGTSGVLVWGAQLEAGDTPGPYQRTFAAAITNLVAIGKAIAATKAAALTAGPALAKGFVRTLTSAAQGFTATLSKANAQVRVLSTGVVLQAFNVRNLGRRFAVTVGNAPSIRGVVGKLMTYQATISPSLRRSVTARLTRVVALVPYLINSTPVLCYASVTCVGRFVRGISRTLRPPATATVEAIQMGVAKTMAVAPAVAASLAKGFSVVRSATQSTAASVGKARVMVRTLALVVTAGAVMGARSVWKVLSTPATAKATLAAISQRLRQLVADVDSTAVLFRSIARPMSAVVAATPKLVRSIGKAVTAAALTVPAVIKGSIPARLTAAVSPVGAIAKGLAYRLTAAVTRSAAMVRSVGKISTAAVGSVAQMVRRFGFTFRPTVITNERISIGVARTLVANLGITAALAKGKLIWQALAASVGAGRPVTNIAQQSQAFTLAPWVLIRAALDPGVFSAPDGTNTAKKLLDSVDASSSHYLYQQFSSALNDNTVYTASVHVKAAEYTSALILFKTKANAYYYTVINLVTGVASGINSPLVVHSQALADGWFRIGVTADSGSGATLPTISVYPYTSGAYTGTGSSGVLIWGAQFEAGAVMSDYILTGATPATGYVPSLVTQAMKSVTAAAAVASSAVLSALKRYARTLAVTVGTFEWLNLSRLLTLAALQATATAITRGLSFVRQMLATTGAGTATANTAPGVAGTIWGTTTADNLNFQIIDSQGRPINPDSPVFTVVENGQAVTLAAVGVAHTNYARYSDDLTRAGAATNFSVTPLDEYGQMGRWHRYVATANTVAFSLQTSTVVNATQDTWLRFRRWYRAVAGSVTDARIGAYTESTWGSDSESTFAILSGPGSLSRVAGSRINISGLSTTTPTLVEVRRLVKAGETASIYSYVRLGTSSAQIGDTLDMSPVEIVDVAGRHITTTAAPVTATDVTSYNPATGAVTLGASAPNLSASPANIYAPVLLKVPGKLLARVVTATATMRRAFADVLSAGVTLAPQVVRTMARRLSAAATLGATMARAVALFINRKFYVLGATLRRSLRG